MSNAISSQGTRFELQATAAGAPKNITAITKANPGVLSINAHGFKVGDVVDLAAITGMVELNGRTAIVAPSALTANAFSLLDSITGLPIDTTNYTAWTAGGTATPKVFVETVEHKSYQFQPAARAELDKTTLVSSAKEFAAGLKDFGSFSVTLNFVRSEPAQQRMKAALNLQNIWFRMTDPTGVPILFLGLVKSLSESGQVDGIPQGTLEIRVSGEQIVVM